MPPPSRARTTSPVPYLAARGSMAAMLSASPLTEFRMGLPRQTRRARSRAAGSEQSMTRGRGDTRWMARTRLGKASPSSMSGSPALTTRKSAPSCCSWRASSPA